MLLLRKILFPFAALYDMVTAIRNYFYDAGIFKSYSFNVPWIAVGNLSTGGTGKSPQIEYLIRLLSRDLRVAVLSRGYGRKSTGFILADSNSTASVLGDEPFQFYRKFSQITVAVDADRVNGINQLVALKNPDLILLDDAFQHRRVKAGMYILLTSFGDLYADDYLLPTGNLRESRKGAKRANLIIVTKCPPNLTIEAQQKIIQKLKPQKSQSVYFTSISYDKDLVSGGNKVSVDTFRAIKKVLLAGIAKPKPFFDYLKNQSDTIMEFSDHHDFSPAELSVLSAKAKKIPIVTTEKDYVRLLGKMEMENVFYLPVKTMFLKDQSHFDQEILSFIRKKMQ